MTDIGLRNKWLVVVNPKARGGQLAAEWPCIADDLALRGLDREVVFTRHRYHAVELVVSAIRRGYRKFVAVGGDGTVSEVINGMFLQQEVNVQDLLLGVIPAGSGNDWCRMYGNPGDFSTAFQVVEEEYAVPQDIGMIELEESGVRKRMFVVNGVGVGLDAMICRYCNRSKERGARGKGVYLRAALKALFRYHSKRGRITVDGRVVFEGRLLSVALGIGKYSGGGMMQTPDARVDDGLVDVTVIKNASRLRVLREFPKLFSGKIYSVRDKVLFARGREVAVECEPDETVEADGEVIGTTMLRFWTLPRALRVSVPAPPVREKSAPAVGERSAPAVGDLLDKP